MINIKQFMQETYKTAKDKGWYKSDVHPLAALMLVVSEIAEACEEVRKGTPVVYFNTENGVVTTQDLGGEMNLRVGEELQKPEGELIELADAVIRIFDYCAHRGYDLESAIKAKSEYNKTRSYRHGNKKY